MNLRYATCLVYISCIRVQVGTNQERERERESWYQPRERERERESPFLFRQYYLLMIFDFPFSVKLGKSVVSGKNRH